MIDIIIYSNNEIELEKTLMSIYLQEIEVPFNVIVISKQLNKEIINRYNNYYPIKNLKDSVNIEEIILEKTTSQFLLFIAENNIFYNINSLNLLYTTAQKENRTIQGKILKTTDVLNNNLNGIILKRDNLDTEPLILDQIVCIQN